MPGGVLGWGSTCWPAPACRPGRVREGCRDGWAGHAAGAAGTSSGTPPLPPTPAAPAGRRLGKQGTLPAHHPPPCPPPRTSMHPNAPPDPASPPTAPRHSTVTHAAAHPHLGSAAAGLRGAYVRGILPTNHTYPASPPLSLATHAPPHPPGPPHPRAWAWAYLGSSGMYVATAPCSRMASSTRGSPGGTALCLTAPLA